MLRNALYLSCYTSDRLAHLQRKVEKHSLSQLLYFAYRAHRILEGLRDTLYLSCYIGEVTQETGVKGGYCDFMIGYEGKPFAIIEVKKISGGLTDNHLTQARHYAQDNPLNWVILTNGDEWQVHYLYYNKKRGENPEPMLFHLFTTSFTDTTIKASERIEMLYLLSKEAKRHDELEAYYDLLQALSPQELTKRLLREDVMYRIRIGIKNDIGFRIDNDELAERILEIIKNAAIPPNSSYLIKKLSK